MSSDTTKKSKIIYERLYNEYGGGWDTQEEFAKLLGITRQGLDYRKAKNVIKYDEIKRLLPEVNRQWLHSDDEEELRQLPVKGTVEEPEVQYAASVDLPKGGQLSRDHMKQLLEQIESIARILKDNL